jgi:hypothetical protein
MTDHFFDTISGNASMLPLNKEFDKITAKFRSSIGTNNVCVSVIYKITNDALNQAFDARAAAILEARGTAPKVVEVYHGTTLKAAANIVNTGFDPAYSTVAAYGKGTYASPSVSMALTYCQDAKKEGDFSMIFLCRFLKGTYGKTSTSKHIDTSVADYSGDGHNILVTPYADGIIPDYLLCYYQWT